MRKLLKSLLTNLLASLSRSIVTKYKPQVVMVTGSVGKTSTKDAVAAVLSKKFYVRKSEKSYNSEIGVPLTIIGAENPWSNPFAWLRVFGKAFSLIFAPDTYPSMLVLEVGADQPGDLRKILSIVKPHAVVVTLLPSVPVHVEFYADAEAVRDEEFSPALALSGGPLIISADDLYAVEKAKSVGVTKEVTTYGISDAATVQITDVDLWTNGVTQEVSANSASDIATISPRIFGMQARFIVAGESYVLKVRDALGRSQLYAPAAAVAAGLAFGMNVPEVLEGLEEYVAPSGRGRIFDGKKGTILIDDTYNSSPAAVDEILTTLAKVPKEYAKRKVLVLGDMLELGKFSEAEHARVGHMVVGIADVLVTVGIRAKGISDAALQDGMAKDLVWHFGTSQEAAAQIEGLLEEGDMMLIKGSQSVRMERIVRPLLAHFQDVKDLVRQDEEWTKR